jgi:hypothetical protein
MIGFRVRWTVLWVALIVCALSGGCGSDKPTRYPAQYPAYGAMGMQGATVAPFAVAPGGLAATPTKPGDPINNIDIPWLRDQSRSDYAELSGALEPAQKARITGIPLVFDDNPGQVNAFAACTGGGAALIAITDGMLDVTAHLAQCQATDEQFGTRKTDEYIRYIAQNQRWGAPLVHPPESFWDPRQKNDPRKIERQHQIFDEEIGFVLGHEMGHHYLGHLPCSAGNVTASEANVVLRSAVPGFNQVNEVGADTGGTRNVLSTGAVRRGYKWTEGGALLLMRFFAGIRQFRPTDVVFAFQSTHPPPELRTPIIQQTAATWRMSGGMPLPIPLPL